MADTRFKGIGQRRRFRRPILHVDDVADLQLLHDGGILLHENAQAAGRYIPEFELINRPRRAKTKFHTMVKVEQLAWFRPSFNIGARGLLHGHACTFQSFPDLSVAIFQLLNLIMNYTT